MMQTLPASSPAGSFPFQLTEQQRKALDAMWTFLQPAVTAALFLLVGFAGTGKSQHRFSIGESASQPRETSGSDRTHQ